MHDAQPTPARTFRMIVQTIIACLAVASLVTSCSRSPITAPVESRSIDHGVAGLSNEDGDGYEVVVTLSPGTDPRQVAHDNGAALLGESQGFAVFAFPPFELPEKINSRVLSDPRIVTSEPNAILESAETLQRAFAFDDGFGTAATYAAQPAAAAIRLGGGLAVSKGEGVVIAILDTGIDPTHPKLAGSIVGGYDFIGEDADPTDVRDFQDNDRDGFVDEGFGHGTHVAGIVSLAAPRARLLIVRVLDADGRGDVRTVAAGVRWATEHGARVINMSLGMLQSSPAIRNAIAQANSRGIVCVASAGNRGTELPAEFPASSPDVIAVAATDASGHPAEFTSYAPFVALCAPGVGVRSTFPGGGYRLWSGTSMSCGFISGAAALVLANHPGWGRGQVMSRLAHNSAAIVGSRPVQEGKLGMGTLDLAAALAPDIPAAEVDENNRGGPVDRSPR
jgi:subtilisin family serine protease